MIPKFIMHDIVYNFPFDQLKYGIRNNEQVIKMVDQEVFYMDR